LFICSPEKLKIFKEKRIQSINDMIQSTEVNNVANTIAIKEINFDQAARRQQYMSQAIG
jgi:hypothetical protein